VTVVREISQETCHPIAPPYGIDICDIQEVFSDRLKAGMIPATTPDRDETLFLEKDIR
jgi:hypothetical protein